MSDYIQPLTMNGLHGRMLYMPAPKNKKRDILLIYGHHSALERMYGIAEDLNQYGSVTMPDLPGFGGMDSFYKVGMEPTLDAFADYLAAYIKLRYKNKKITIAGMSFGFVVITRMLQKYPRLTKNIELLISVVGFCHHDDLIFTKTRYQFYLNGARVFSRRLPALFFRNVILNPVVLRAVYGGMHNAKSKFQNLSEVDKKRAMEFEVYLWRCNDVRTYMATTIVMFTLDNCHKQISLPVEHISVSTDQYFNHAIVEQHMRVVFTDFREHIAQMDSHAPSIIADKHAAQGLLPKTLRTMLNRSPV